MLFFTSGPVSPSSYVSPPSTALSSSSTTVPSTWIAWTYETQLVLSCSTVPAKPVIHTFPTVILAIEYIPEQQSTSSSSTISSVLPPAIVVLTDDKLLSVIVPKLDTHSAIPSIVYSIDYTATLPRRAHVCGLAYLPSSFSPSSLPVLIIGDKIGDVYAIPYPEVSTKRRYLLSHTGSIFTCIKRGLGRYSNTLITADRDEKIRVSRWPTTFVIDSFCLGHTRYISLLHINETISLAPTGTTNNLSSSSSAWNYQSTDILITGSGDGTLRVWHYKSGTLLHTLYLGNTAFEHIQNTQNTHNGKVLSAVEPYAWCSNDSHADGLMIQSANEDDTEGGTTNNQQHQSSQRNDTTVSSSSDHPTTNRTDNANAMDDESDADANDEEIPTTNTTTTATPATSTTIVSPTDIPTIPDTAVGFTIQPVSPAVTPLQIMEVKTGNNSSLYAVLVEGENYVRILRLYTNTLLNIPVDRNQIHGSNGTLPVTLPQVRLEQIGYIKVPNTIFGITKVTYTDQYDILAICTTTTTTTSPTLSSVTSSDAPSFTLRTYRITYHSHTQTIDSYEQHSSSSTANYPSLPGIDEWNTYFTERTDNPRLLNIPSLSSLSSNPIHGCIMTDQPDDYDKRGIAVL